MSDIFLNSSALFSSPSFLKGVSRVVDLFGYLDNYNYKKGEKEADLEALKRDWSIIGIDIDDSIKKYAEEEGTTTTTTSSIAR
ncbi:MAG: hypothetical protein HY426_01490 [Candidatus Levybacteria bacterium]|nr:hypothetical protein [Candidatus Levybacteria bacterium]